jgi:hypothetical protein
MGTWGWRRYLAVRHTTITKTPRLSRRIPVYHNLRKCRQESFFGSSGSSLPAGYYAFRFAMFLWKEIRSGISDMFQQAWIGVFKRQMRDRALHARNQSDNWRFLGVVKIRNYHLFEL